MAGLFTGSFTTPTNAPPAPDEAEPPTNKLWMGDLEPHMDEAFVQNMYSQFGYQVLSVKMIRNLQTGMMARYCFVEFADPMTAKSALYNLKKESMPGCVSGKKFKLNWASKRLEAGTTEHNVFVADLSPDVTSQQLLEHFLKRYKSVRFAKVIEDETGTSKGYGFVRFCDQSERDRSLTELDNTLGLGSKAIKIREALPPKPQTNPFAGMMMMSNTPQTPQPPPPPSQYAPPTNPTPHFTGHSGVIIQGSGSASILGQPQVATYSQQYQQQYPQGQQLYNPPLHPAIDPDEYEVEVPVIFPNVKEDNAKIFNEEKTFYLKLEESRWHLPYVSNWLNFKS